MASQHVRRGTCGWGWRRFGEPAPGGCGWPCWHSHHGASGQHVCRCCCGEALNKRHGSSEASARHVKILMCSVLEEALGKGRDRSEKVTPICTKASLVCSLEGLSLLNSPAPSCPPHPRAAATLRGLGTTEARLAYPCTWTVLPESGGQVLPSHHKALNKHLMMDGMERDFRLRRTAKITKFGLHIYKQETQGLERISDAGGTPDAHTRTLRAIFGCMSNAIFSTCALYKSHSVLSVQEHKSVWGHSWLYSENHIFTGNVKVTWKK